MISFPIPDEEIEEIFCYTEENQYVEKRLIKKKIVRLVGSNHDIKFPEKWYSLFHGTPEEREASITSFKNKLCSNSLYITNAVVSYLNNRASDMQKACLAHLGLFTDSGLIDRFKLNAYMDKHKAVSANEVKQEDEETNEPNYVLHLSPKIKDRDAKDGQKYTYKIYLPKEIIENYNVFGGRDV